MPERRDPEVQDLRARALAESVFGLVEELTRKISRNRETTAREGLMKQSAGQLDKVRRYVVGPDKEKLTPATAHRMTGEYMLRATHLEDALVTAEVEDASVSGHLEKLKGAFMPLPQNKLIEFQPHVSRELAKLHAIDEQRGSVTDPAWTMFFYDAALKHLSIPDFDGDEWYGQAMSERSTVLRKTVLPIVAYDMLQRAAKEGARPMPKKEVYMEHRHRAVNALEELVEVWEKDMPPIADKYTAVLAALDQELQTLSLYYRYQGQ